MQVRNITIILLLSLLCMTSCNNDWEDSLPPAEAHLFIRFVSPAGTNILDSLCLGGEPYSQVDKKDIQVKCINAWDNEVITVHSLAWQTIPSGYYWKGKAGKDGTEMPCMTEGTVLHVSWTDSNLFGSENRPANYLASYIITFNSLRIFDSEETHTVKWDVRVRGNTYDAAGVCEIDGKEYSLVGDAVYDHWSIYYGDELPSGRAHEVEAQLTMPVTR